LGLLTFYKPPDERVEQEGLRGNTGGTRLTGGMEFRAPKKGGIELTFSERCSSRRKGAELGPQKQMTVGVALLKADEGESELYGKGTRKTTGIRKSGRTKRRKCRESQPKGRGEVFEKRGNPKLTLQGL